MFISSSYCSFQLKVMNALYSRMFLRRFLLAAGEKKTVIPSALDRNSSLPRNFPGKFARWSERESDFHVCHANSSRVIAFRGFRYRGGFTTNKFIQEIRNGVVKNMRLYFFLRFIFE